MSVHLSEVKSFFGLSTTSTLNKKMQIQWWKRDYLTWCSHLLLWVGLCEKELRNKWCVSCVGKRKYKQPNGAKCWKHFFKKVPLKKVLIVRVTAAGKIQYWQVLRKWQITTAKPWNKKTSILWRESWSSGYETRLWIRIPAPDTELTFSHYIVFKL